MSFLIQSIFHPSEIVAIAQFYYKYKYFKPTPKLEVCSENKSKIRCYEFLKQTSRSFATVIQGLDEEVRDAVCLFYLVLRGLDTIEDDMTLPIETKEPLLRTFNDTIYKKGWTYTESGPNERDRNLLLEFNVVIDEFLSLRKEYKDVIADITSETGNGMADYAKDAAHNKYGVITNHDFDMYCYYVAGLVGIGLSRLFSASKLEGPDVAANTELAKAMGLFLQKTNIIRDYLDDDDGGRGYWPKEIWAKYADELTNLKKPGYETNAIYCLSDVIVNALQHVPDCLTYMHRLRNPSVFGFCAIPQVMAIATIATCFRNYDIYKKMVKIRKGESVKLMLKCTNIYEVASVFRHYCRVIISKNDPKDPNFLKISMACGRIEQWCTVNLPGLKTSAVDSPGQENEMLLFIGFFLLAFTAYLLYYFNWEHFHYDKLEIFDAWSV